MARNSSVRKPPLLFHAGFLGPVFYFTLKELNRGTGEGYFPSDPPEIHLAPKTPGAAPVLFLNWCVSRAPLHFPVFLQAQFSYFSLSKLNGPLEKAIFSY